MTPYHHSHHHPSDDMPSFQKRLKQFKPFFAPLGVIILILGIIATVQQVQRLQEVRKGAFAGGVQLLLSSSAQNNTVQEGDEFTVNVLLDTKTKTVSAADITLTFPEENLEVTDIKLGPMLPVSLTGVPVTTGGKVNFVVASQPATPVNGSGVIATITFAALTKSTQPIQIGFDTVTEVAATEHIDTNVLDTATPLAITINESSIANGAGISFEPSKSTVAPNEEFTVTAVLDPKGRQITGAELHLLYDSDKVEVLEAVEGDALPIALQKDLNLDSGHAMFAVASTPAEPQTQTGTIAVFTLRALGGASGTVPLSFSPATKVSELGKADLNVVGETSGTSITISGNPITPNPSIITASPTPTNSPTLTPSVSPAPKLFKASPDGAQEVPEVPTDATGTAYILLAADRRTAKVSLTYNGLSSTQTMAHIHGPAAIGRNASPIYNLPVGTFTNYPINLTAAQATQLENGLWYINVHTENFGNGEIRGQFALTNEDPNITPLPTSGEPTHTPMPTLTPQATSMLVSIRIPTIGSNAATENTQPLNPSRQVNVELYKGLDLARTVSGVLSFDGSVFKGNINVGENFESGLYTLKLKLPNSLRKNLGTYTINTNITVPVVTMIMGDTIVDNKLNIFDYNIIISCYQDRAGTDTCEDDAKIADLNDNGTVDSIDYNLIIRTFEDQIIGD